VSQSFAYTVSVSASARRDLKRLKKRLSQKQFERIDDKISALANDPRPPGCENIEGIQGAYRVRDGDYRIVYFVDDNSAQVKVARVRGRKDVYRH